MKKTLTLWNYFTIGFGAIIGTGWLLMVGDWMIEGGGPVAAIVAFAIGGAILLPMGAVFGELTSAIPVAGGIVEYVDRTFGHKASFVTAWFLALGNGIICPWETIAISMLAGEFLPALKTIPLYTVMGITIYLPTLLVGLGAAILVWYMNHKGAKMAAALQSWMTRILLAGMFMAIVIALFVGSPSHLLPVFEATDTASGFLPGVLAVLVMTPFFYAGFETIPQAAEEAAQGLDWRKFGQIIVVALGSAALFYVCAIYSFGTLIPWTGFITYPVPALTVMETLGLAIFAKLLQFAALCGIVSTMNSFFNASTRIMLAMARKGQLPAGFAKLHPEYRTPLWGNTFLGILTVAGAFVGKALLVPLTNVSSLAFIFACTMVSVACLKMRYTEPDLPRPYKVPFGKAGIWAAIVAGLAVLGLLCLPFSPAFLQPIEWAIVAVWLVGGLVFLSLVSRSTARTTVPQ